MKIWFIKLNNRLSQKSKYVPNSLFYNLNLSKLTSNKKNFHADFGFLKIDITYCSLIMDINYTAHGFFIFYRLSNYKKTEFKAVFF